MLTEEERDWKNCDELTEIQKEFLYGMDWVREKIVDNALWFWRDNNRTGFETVDKMMDEIIDDLKENLKEYIGNDKDAWYKVNSSLGTVFTERSVLDEVSGYGCSTYLSKC